MGERTEYTPGTFCSVDLAAADVEAGKAFYSGLFGWDLGDSYRDWTPCLLEGRIVAGIIDQHLPLLGMTALQWDEPPAGLEGDCLLWFARPEP